MYHLTSDGSIFYSMDNPLEFMFNCDEPDSQIISYTLFSLSFYFTLSYVFIIQQDPQWVISFSILIHSNPNLFNLSFF